LGCKVDKKLEILSTPPLKSGEAGWGKNLRPVYLS